MQEKKVQKHIKRLKKEKNSIFFETKELIFIVLVTAIVGFFMGFFINQKDSNLTLSRYESELISNYRYILENSYKDIDARNLVSVAVKGMIDYLDDPYADYISTDNVDTFNMIISGEYQGLGIQVGYNDSNEPIVTYVFSNSPADINGLKVGDILIAIGGNNILGDTLDEIKNLISQFDDSEFGIIYKRDGKEYNIELKKGKVIIESVEDKIYERNNNKIGYIKLSNFATNSYEQFNDNLLDLESRNIDSLIIDLRNNTGGQLAVVDNIVSLFIDKDEVIYQMKEKGKITKYYSHGNNSRKYPIVVLTNEYSASASELMASALKEVYGATIIGINTYGKGTAQEIVTLANGEQYKFTTKEWLTAKGNSIEEIGIEPTIYVEQSEKYYLDYSEENDNQLQYAIEFLFK